MGAAASTDRRERRERRKVGTYSDPAFREWLAADRAARTWFDDWSEADRAALLAGYAADLDAMYSRAFPCEALHGDRRVTVLGPSEVVHAGTGRPTNIARGQMIFLVPGDTEWPAGYSTCPGAEGLRELDGTLWVRRVPRRDPRRERGMFAGLPSIGETERYERGYAPGEDGKG